MENSTQVNESLFSEHLKKWGVTCDPISFYGYNTLAERHNSQAINAFLRNYLIDSWRDQTLPDVDFSNYYYRLFNCFQPAQAIDNPMNLAIYESKDKYDRDIRLSGKPGRIIKRILPFATESFCASFAEWFKEQFATETYTIKESTESEHFALAYSGTQSKTTNPNLSFIGDVKLYAKSLQASCMRHDKSDFRGGLPIHPSEVYASGDFKIIWAEDSKGYIAARCVVNVKQRDSSVYRPGPIYTATDSAFNAVAAYMVAQGYDKQGVCDSTGWHGARIKAIEFDGGYIAPFLDLCGEGNLTSSGDYFRLTRNGDYTFRETSGVIESGQFCCSCGDCGEGLREDDNYFYIESSGESVCESCFDSSYFHCTGNGATYPNDDGVEVYYMSYGRVRSRTYSQDYVDSGRGDCVHCDNESEYWSDSDVTWIECEEIYTPSHSLADSYFLSEYDSEYYPKSDKIELTAIGQFWTLAQAIDSGNYDIVTDSDGNTVATLKDHLEINDFGNVVNNQMQLAIAA